LQTYIERDIRTVSNIGSLQTFGNFIGLLAALTGQEVNRSELGRELGIDRKTALAWLEIAESTYQWLCIKAFSRNAINKIAGKLKGYFTDPGFICYLQRISSPDAILNHPSRGRLFKSYLAMEIVKSFQSWRIVTALYHFRTYSGAEIDIILELNGVLYPIEINNQKQPGQKRCQKLQLFQGLFSKREYQKRVSDLHD